MSYILDALKRAESERERGGVPGLHSQSVPLRRPIADSRAVAKPLLWAGAALALALLGVLAWFAWVWPGSGLGPAVVGASVPGMAVSPPIASQTAIAASAQTTVSAATAASALTLTPAAVTDTASPVVKSAASVVSAKPAPRTGSVATVAAAPAPASPRILPVGELPPDIRQTLPKVVISGSTYSDNQALRMLIINGEVFREGEKPAPDLQLEQIRAKSAVLNFKGLRYSVVY